MTDNSTDDLGRLYEAIGFVVTAWSYVEQSMDGCIAVMYSIPAAAALEREPPINTRRKVQFLKKALQLPELSEFSASGMPLMDRVMNLKDFRHRLLHSILMSPKSAGGVFRYASLKVKADSHSQTHWEFDLNRFPETRQKIEALATDLLAFASHLTGRIAGQLPPQP